MAEALEKYLVNFNEYYVENFHSKLHANININQSVESIIDQAYIIEKIYEIPENLIERPFKKKFPPYYLASLECIVARKCLPTGYHTTCIPSSGICDHCRQDLSNSTNKIK
ncbi:6201_t:CDS:2 [Entrophospora sp. SA101]|nr:6201_t:CDS:2 [Entrophospora sp. SA101]